MFDSSYLISVLKTEMTQTTNKVFEKKEDFYLHHEKRIKEQLNKKFNENT